jgi:two-component system chemotaxis sensor kinase CheA
VGIDTRSEQLRATFKIELDERVQELTELLLQLERGQEGDATRTGIFAALFRGAHNLKGAARAVDLRQVEEAVHALESTLAEARQAGIQPDGAWFDTVYRMLDTISAVYRASMAEQTGMVPEPAGQSIAALSAASPPVSAAPPDTHPETTGAALHDTPAGRLSPEAGVLSRPDELPHGAAVPTSHESAPSRGNRSAPRAESVRVAVSKLDILLEQAGELVVTHGRVAECLRELHDLNRDVAQWRRSWRATRPLRRGLERRIMALPQSVSSHATAAPEQELTTLLHLADRAEQRLATFQQRVTALVARLHDDSLALRLVTRAIEDEVMAVRLLPLSSIFAPLERLVRDLARDTGKEVELTLEGGEAEIDRRILDGLRDPLMHMLRNAVDHGIEPAAARQAQGKPRNGNITLTATARGSAIDIILEDDGAGMDPAALRAAAVSKGLLSEEQAAALSSAEALDLIFRPGFSTREKVSETSGRGVGMDVVRENMQNLGGHITAHSVPGRGTRFVLQVPLTLATRRVILLEVDGQIFALSSLAVEHAARVQMTQTVMVEGSRAVPMGGTLVPILELADLLERPRPDGQPARMAQDPLWRPFLVVHQGDRRLALLVDQLIGEQEIVVKSLSWPLQTVRNVSGAAVLGSGRMVIILNPSDLLRTGLRLIGGRSAHAATPSPDSREAPRKPRLLVVEDSLTTRALEMSILEAAGYEVVSAANGVEALQLLRGQGIDLVVSDVEMPLLDGFALTTEVRRDEKLRHIPVILVTSLETQEYRERGAMAGADAYVLKSQFHQGLLLDTVARLI